jgi:RNA polymerase sigma-70 factor (ECF subfamily)
MAKSVPSATPVSLLSRLCRDPNDPGAWEEFVQHYGPKVLLWCRHWGLQQADAEDVAQEVLLKVAQKMQTFRYDPARSFRAWLKTLAHGAWCDWLERRSRQAQGSGDSRVLELLQTTAARDDLVRKLEEGYDAELLEAAGVRVRLRVGPRSWEAFRLLAFEGKSGAEAAAQLGMTVGAVFMAKSRVQKMLREEILKLEDAS